MLVSRWGFLSTVGGAFSTVRARLSAVRETFSTVRKRLSTVRAAVSTVRVRLSTVRAAVSTVRAHPNYIEKLHNTKCAAEFLTASSEGIEPPSQEPESCVLSFTPRGEICCDKMNCSAVKIIRWLYVNFKI